MNYSIQYIERVVRAFEKEKGSYEQKEQKADQYAATFNVSEFHRDYISNILHSNTEFSIKIEAIELSFEKNIKQAHDEMEKKYEKGYCAYFPLYFFDNTKTLLEKIKK